MRDEKIEKEIVELFFQKEIRKRVEYELSSIKKREHAFNRLNQPKLTLKKKTVYPINKVYPHDVIQKLIELGASEDKAYIMIDDEGKFVTLDEAIDTAFDYGMPVIVYCGNGIAYGQGEQECGSPDRFLLIAKNHEI